MVHTRNIGGRVISFKEAKKNLLATEMSFRDDETKGSKLWETYNSMVQEIRSAKNWKDLKNIYGSNTDFMIDTTR